MHAQERESVLKQFLLGQRLADGLVGGSLVFVGVIQSLGPVEKAPGETDEERAVMTRAVNLKVSDWLHGQASGDTVTVHSAARPAVTKTDSGPWDAWEGVTLTQGAALLVVRWAPGAARGTWMGQPEDVAIAVSDTSQFEPIRHAIAQHHRFERDPDEVFRTPQILRDTPGVLVRSYVLTYLMNGESLRSVDKAAGVLSGLFGQDSVPDLSRPAMADWLASSFYRLAESTRRSVTESLVVSASADDSRITDPALRVLTRLGDQKMLNLKPLLTEARQRKIAQNYRSFQQQGSTPQPHPEFEAQVGLR